jgi:hypothetical protein
VLFEIRIPNLELVVILSFLINKLGAVVETPVRFKVSVEVLYAKEVDPDKFDD